MKKLVVVALALSLSSCGKDGGGSPAAPSAPVQASSAAFTVSIDPANIIVTPSGNAQFPFSARWTLVVNETAGLAGFVNGARVSFVSGACGTFSNVLHWGANDITASAGTNHVNARGNLRIPMGITYVGCFGTRVIDLRIEVDLGDDRGHTFNVVASARAS